MTRAYNLKEVQIEIEAGVTLTADVPSLEALKQLLVDLRSAKLKTASKPATTGDVLPPRSTPTPREGDTPERRVEMRAQLDSGALEKLNLLAFKDKVPQLLRPNALGITEALVLLIFAVETGLGQSKIDYGIFQDLYEAQNIKSGSPLAMVLTNLRNNGVLDKKAYAENRGIRLTAKGEKKAIEILKRAVT